MVGAVLSSFVLRLAPEALADGRIAGRVEVVETGEAASLRSADELVAFLYDHGRARGSGALVDQRHGSEGQAHDASGHGR